MKDREMSLCSKSEFKYHSFTFTFVPSLKSLSFDYTIKNELYKLTVSMYTYKSYSEICDRKLSL